MKNTRLMVLVSVGLLSLFQMPVVAELSDTSGAVPVTALGRLRNSVLGESLAIDLVALLGNPYTKPAPTPPRGLRPVRPPFVGITYPYGGSVLNPAPLPHPRGYELIRVNLSGNTVIDESIQASLEGPIPDDVYVKVQGLYDHAGRAISETTSVSRHIKRLGSCLISGQRFQANQSGDACLDNRTGFLWSTMIKMIIRNSTIGVLNIPHVTEARNFCSTLSASLVGGKSNWSVPTATDLATIIGSEGAYPHMFTRFQLGTPNTHTFLFLTTYAYYLGLFVDGIDPVTVSDNSGRSLVDGYVLRNRLRRARCNPTIAGIQSCSGGDDSVALCVSKP